MDEKLFGGKNSNEKVGFPFANSSEIFKIY
jgi:hypothetical protein